MTTRAPHSSVQHRNNTSSKSGLNNNSNNRKSKTFQTYLFDCCVYSCAHCQAHLARQEDLISKSFQGSHGRAYLFQKVVNVGCLPAEERMLLTGLHFVADSFCESCHTTLGWKYERAFENSQRYKEGKYIIEQARLVKDNGWNPQKEIYMGQKELEVDDFSGAVGKLLSTPMKENHSYHSTASTNTTTTTASSAALSTWALLSTSHSSAEVATPAAAGSLGGKIDAVAATAAGQLVQSRDHLELNLNASMHSSSDSDRSFTHLLTPSHITVLERPSGGVAGGSSPSLYNNSHTVLASPQSGGNLSWNGGKYGSNLTPVSCDCDVKHPPPPYIALMESMPPHSAEMASSSKRDTAEIHFNVNAEAAFSAANSSSHNSSSHCHEPRRNGATGSHVSRRRENMAP